MKAEISDVYLEQFGGMLVNKSQYVAENLTNVFLIPAKCSSQISYVSFQLNCVAARIKIRKFNVRSPFQPQISVAHGQ